MIYTVSAKVNGEVCRPLGAFQNNAFVNLLLGFPGVPVKTHVSISGFTKLISSVKIPIFSLYTAGKKSDPFKATIIKAVITAW